MTKLIKRPCPYLPNNCKASIKKEDLSCYDICNVYQDWNQLISKYSNSFDTTPFDAQKAIKELKALNGAAKRLDYWLEHYYKPLYEWIENSKEHILKQFTLTTYQKKLKYWEPNKLANGKHNPNFTLVGRLSFPVIVYEACFKEYENSPEFEYWNLVFDANIIFKSRLKIGQWEKKAVAPSSSALFQATIYRIEEEERAATLLLSNGAFDIYHQNNPSKYNKEIALLRIKNDLYKDGSFVVPKNCDVAKLYAEHLLLKPYLQELSNKHLDTSYWIHNIEKEQTTGSFKSCESQIGMHGFYGVAETKVYTPLLTHILTVKFEARTVSSKKASTLLVNGSDYIPSYKEGYKEGIAYFKSNFSVSPSILFGDNSKAYIDNLHLNYYHTNHYKLHKGWQFVKEWYPLAINHKVIKDFGYYAGIVSEVDKLIKQYPIIFIDFHSCSEVKEEKEEIPQKKPSIRMIAIKCFYEGTHITRKNSNSIVEQYGHKSGEKLFQHYTYYSSNTNRTAKTHPFTKQKMRNKIELFEKVLELLPPDKQKRIIDELQILKTHFDNEFG